MRRALVRPPGSRLDDGLRTHRRREPVDVPLAHKQWDAYCATLEEEGWETVQVPPADDCPDAVFVEDAVVIYGRLAVVTRPGAPESRAETDAAAETLGELGYRIAGIDGSEGATLEGGDVLKHDGNVWVGLSGRTNHAGMRQLARLLEPHGARVDGVTVTQVLHLKSAVTALPDGTILGHPPLLDAPGRWDPLLRVPEAEGAAVVVLDEHTVLMSTSAPRTRSVLEGRGLRVVAVDISEFEKLEGCVTCLSVRLRHLP